MITEGNHAFIYQLFVQQYIFEPAGVDWVSFYPQDGALQTLYYDALNPNASAKPGGSANSIYVSGAKNLHVSAIELARFMVYLRYADALISHSSRAIMDNLKLGWSSNSNTAGNYAGKYWHSGLGDTYSHFVLRAFFVLGSFVIRTCARQGALITQNNLAKRVTRATVMRPPRAPWYFSVLSR